MNYPISIIRSGRRTLALQISPQGRLIARAPYGLPEEEIYRFINEKRKWIDKHLKNIRLKNEAKERLPGISVSEIESLADRALDYIPKRVAHFAPMIGVDYGRITIRNQKTRWGSCSAKGNLNFNCLLMLTPPEIIDYVIVHELCHRIEMNHSPRFWKEVERIIPDYRERKKWLKDHGSILIERMKKGLTQM